jgi:hypothetical protein
MERVGLRSARAEARRLEDKVAKVAAKKCSVEEVSTLHKELQEWLTSEVKPDDQVCLYPLARKPPDLVSRTDFFPFPQRCAAAGHTHEPPGSF